MSLKHVWRKIQVLQPPKSALFVFWAVPMQLYRSKVLYCLKDQQLSSSFSIFTMQQEKSDLLGTDWSTFIITILGFFSAKARNADISVGRLSL